MLPIGETISPRSKFPDRPPSINQFCQRSLGRLIGVHTRMAPHPQGFFEIAVAAQIKFKDADAIANAIGCAPLPEILIQNFLIPWLKQGLRYAPVKIAMTEPNRIVSPSFNSASVTKSPLICVPFVESKSFSE